MNDRVSLGTGEQFDEIKRYFYVQVIFNLFKRGISSNCSSLPHRPRYPGENERKKKKLRPHDEKNERNL